MGVYFPTTDLCVNDMGARSTGRPVGVVWIDPEPVLPWEVDRELPTYRAGPYDQRCKLLVGDARCERIWNHEERHGLPCKIF